MKTLICGAIEQEISLFQKEYDTFIVGVGLVESAIRLSLYLSENEYNRVIFTGTVGAYKTSHLSIGDVVTSHAHILIGASSVLDHSYFPRSMQQEVLFNSIFETDIPDVRCASVLEITKTSELADKIVEQNNVSIEHMELFSIASVCNKKGIEFSSVLGVANNVYEHSHIEWLQNNEMASENAQNKLYSLLK